LNVATKFEVGARHSKVGTSLIIGKPTIASIYPQSQSCKTQKPQNNKLEKKNTKTRQ
jgi:hypothetical protein